MESSASLNDLKINREDRHSSSGGWIIGVIAILILVAMAAVWWFSRSQAIEVNTAVATEAASTSASAGIERTVLNASGYVTARREATVSSKVTGKVEEVFVEEGMKVTQGQIVARLDDTNVTASLQLAIAQLEATQASLAETRVRVIEAERELARQQQLTGKQMAAQSELDRSVATANALKARLQQQQAEIKVQERSVASWKQQMDDTIIRAPFSGIVTSKNAQPGEMISPMSAGGFTRTGICTIVDMESLEIEIDVNESYINRVHSGQGVVASLDAYPDWKIPCKVIAIIPTADRQKATVKVRVGFQKLDPRILPEMSVKVGFYEAAATAKAGNSESTATAAARTVIIPSSAVRTENSRDAVYIVRNGKAERRAVTVAGRNNEESRIQAGVSNGERVAVGQVTGLADGVRVKDLDLK